MIPDHGTKYTDAEVEKIKKELENVYKQAQRDIKKKMSDFSERHRVRSERYLKMVSRGQMTIEEYASWLRGQVFIGEQWNNKKKQIADILYNSNKTAVDIITKHMYNVFAENANYEAFDLERKIGANLGFGLYDSNTVARLIKDKPTILPPKKLKAGKDKPWNMKNMRSALTQGIIQGESTSQIANRFSKTVSGRNAKSMMVHARTAITGAQNAGRYEALLRAKEMGLNVYKEWMATLDARTRDSHAHLDGERVDVEESFSNDLRYPGDPEGHPREVYNCRCTLVGDIDEYDFEYERLDNVERRDESGLMDKQVIRSMPYDQWKSIKQAEKDTGIHINLPTPKKFKRDFDLAKSTIPKGAEWRVDDTYTVEDYEGKKLFELDGGSVVAVTDNGDIVSVCKNLNGNDKGSDLLRIAIANGGDRLDAFGDGLYEFYTKNGFEPVSWTPFDEEYAPHDWVKGRDNPEPVIFYRFTGRKTNLSYVDFIKGTKPSSDYDTAMKIRDKLIDNRK